MESAKFAITNKRILIIGGLGLIGSTIARYCLEQGAQVTIADNRSPEYGANDFNLSDLAGKFTLIIGDIRDSNFINSIVPEHDFIFNFAAQISHNIGIENPILDNQLNCIGHINLLMACKNYNPKAKIIYPGSRLQYGRIRHLPVAEDHPREPLSIYAIHKNTAEQYYQTFFHHYGIRSTCFRITNPYGPRSQMKTSAYSLINWFIRLIMDNQVIKIYGTGEQIRDYIYIDDLIEGLVLTAINDQSDGQVYNIGSGTPTKFIDMARIVMEVAGRGKIENVPWPKNYDHFETGDFYADISRIKNHVNWQPRTSLREGIEKTFQYYEKFKQYYW